MPPLKTEKSIIWQQIDKGSKCNTNPIQMSFCQKYWKNIQWSSLGESETQWIIPHSSQC